MPKKFRGFYLRGQRWYFKYKNADGAWDEFATRTTNFQQARKIRAEFLRELEEGRLPNEQSSWTLSQAASEWLDTRRLRVARGTFLSEVTITRTLQRVLGKTIK